jgi:hypothetical protein
VNPFPVDKRMMFEDMLAGAMKGQPPITENGLNDAVYEALIQVAVLRTEESADAARAVFDQSFGTDPAQPTITD